MKVFRAVALATIIGACACGFAQSAKNSVQVSNIAILNWTDADTPWSTVLSSVIKTSQQKDLIIGVSLETGLYTRTLVKGKNGSTDVSEAQAGIEVRVLVDGVELAEPGVVQFEKRRQELTAVLGGVLSECTDSNLDGTITDDECSFTDEEIQLVLETMAAHHFNFVLDNVGTGEHVIQVQARITLGESAQAGSAEAKATIGKGSVTVEEVRLVKDADITL